MSAIGRASLVTDLIAAGSLNLQADGFYTLTIDNTNGDVLSVQPDGSFQPRPKGTAGPYEKAGLNGNTLVYCPEGKTVYALPFFEKVPNV